MKTFAVLQIPGPNWVEGKPFYEQPLLEHGKYMKQLHDKGLLKLGGPYMDSSGGLWVFEAEDEAAAQKILVEDPATIEGVFSSELREWMQVDWEQYSP